MDSIYSLSLLLSLVFGALGTAITVLLMMQPDRLRTAGAGVALAAFVCGSAALIFGVISISVHLVFGHGPDSDAAMTTLEFLIHHKAYWLVPILTVLAFQGARAS